MSSKVEMTPEEFRAQLYVDSEGVPEEYREELRTRSEEMKEEHDRFLHCIDSCLLAEGTQELLSALSELNPRDQHAIFEAVATGSLETNSGTFLRSLSELTPPEAIQELMKLDEGFAKAYAMAWASQERMLWRLGLPGSIQPQAMQAEEAQPKALKAETKKPGPITRALRALRRRLPWRGEEDG
jgi:hypothetical protein